MAFEYEFTGTESLDEIFQKLPQKYAKKPMISTFRKGARIFTRVLRRNTPEKSKETRKAIGVKAGKSKKYPNIQVGFRQGKFLPGFQKAYWHNYGTLANRDPTHNFQSRRGSKSANWSGGIRPKGFVEQSWNSTADKVQQKIDQELENETRKFLEKHAVK